MNTDRIFGFVHCLFALQKVEYGTDSERFDRLLAHSTTFFLAAVAFTNHLMFAINTNKIV